MADEKQTNVQTVHFTSIDGLLITADLYPVAEPLGFMVLCHRSHSNRGEYRETAQKLNALGFSCLAIDQRSGMNVYGYINETSTLAKQQGFSTGYLNARQDIEAAVAYAYALNQGSPIVLVGSSYSASLALLIGTATEEVKAVAAFSPGEHLRGVNVAESLKDSSVHIYVTSAKKEIDEVRALMRFVDPRCVTQFTPQVDGFHGSKTLWATVTGSESYWKSFSHFLLNLPDRVPRS